MVRLSLNVFYPDTPGVGLMAGFAGEAGVPGVPGVDPGFPLGDPWLPSMGKLENAPSTLENICKPW